MRILALETSCDETAAAVVELREGRVLVRSETVITQDAVHAEYGGVVPELASRAHLENSPQRFVPRCSRRVSRPATLPPWLRAIDRA